MQMLDVVTYPQKPSVQGNECGKPGKPDKQESFSDVLGQEIAQGNNNVDSEAQDKNGPAAEPNPEVANLAALLWISQNLPAQTAQVSGLSGQTSDKGAQVQTTLIGDNKALRQPTGAEAIDSVPAKPEAAEVPFEQNREAAIPLNLRDGKAESGQAGLETQSLKEANAETTQAVKDTAVKTDSVPESQTRTEPGKQENIAAAVSDKKQSAGGEEKQNADFTPASQTDPGERRVFSESVKSPVTASADQARTKADVQSLSQTIMNQIADGKRELEIWLQPANLGKLAIKVAYESGRAMISIMCTNEKTMELISQNAKNLGMILEQHMGTQTVVLVDRQAPDYLQQQAGQQNQSGYQQQENDRSEQQENEKDADSLSFLQQLRLGLA